jgi:RHS repeat-associated protein
VLNGGVLSPQDTGMNTAASAETTSCLQASDLLGSPTLEVYAATSKQINYTPFGHALDLRPKSLGFTGQIKELGSALYILGSGYRSYSPSLMRFTRTDDISPFGQGGLNAYAYCLADPINHSDPSGHFLARALGRLLAKFRNRPPSLTSWRSVKSSASNTMSTVSSRGSVFSDTPDWTIGIVSELTTRQKATSNSISRVYQQSVRGKRFAELRFTEAYDLSEFQQPRIPALDLVRKPRFLSSAKERDIFKWMGEDRLELPYFSPGQLTSIKERPWAELNYKGVARDHARRDRLLTRGL